MALITTEQRNELTTLFVAMFKAAPGAANLSEMVLAVEAGSTLAEVAASLAMRPSFSQVYPGFLTGQEFADRVVANLLTDATPSGAKAFATSWVLGKLNAGESRSAILAQAVQALRATQNANYDDAKAQLDNKVAVANYYSITKEQSSDDLADLQEVIAGVTSSMSTVTEAETVIDSDTSVGELYSLTDGRDNYDLASSTKADIVEAILDGADSTLTTLDKVTGNGDTVLQLVAVQSGTAPLVQMSGIGAIDVVVAGATGTYSIDGGDLGSDVSSISISGDAGLNFVITDLESEGNDLHVSQSGGANTLSADGSLGGVNYDFSMINTGSNTNSLDLSWVGDVSLAVDLGESAYLDLTLSVTDSATSADASVGDILMKDIAISVAEDASGYIEVSITADAATSGNASVGDVTFGDITLTAAEGADSASFEVDISASADVGDATIGNLMVGEVNLANAGSGDLTVSLTMSATVSDDGNATVGSVTIGDIHLSNSDDNYNYFYLWDYAYVGDNGNASVGDIHVGDIFISTATETTGGTGSVTISAEAEVIDKGDASIGNITIGDVFMNLADSADYAWMSLEFTAEVNTGSASIGDFSIGDISMTLGDDAGSASWSIELSASVDVKSGQASIGDVAIGDLSFDLGETSDGWFGIYIDVENDGKGNSVLGDVMIGDITANVGDEGGFYGTLEMDVSADTGDAIIGNVTIGDISVHLGDSADDDGDINISIYASATSGDAKIGNVTVGDIDFTLGFNSVGTFDLEITADGDDTSMIGDVTIGAVTVQATTAASAEFSYDVYIESYGHIGNVTLGGVTANMQDLVNTTLDFDVFISASEDIGVVSVGDVAYTADVVDYFFEYEAKDASAITLGDITLTANDMDFEISITASGDLSDVTIGNVAIEAETLDLNTGIFVSASGDVGNVSIGDITVDNDGDDTLTIDIYATREMGNVMIGNIDTGVNEVDLDIHADRTMGDVTIGDLTFGGVVTDGESLTFDLELDGTSNETIGDVLLGDVNITATGAKNVDAFVGFTADIGTNASTDDSVGTVTIGDIALSSKSANTAANLDGTADKVEASVNIEADYSDAVLVGDITLTLTNSLNAANTVATKALDVAAAYVDISADEDALTVGNISVSTINNTASTVSIKDSANDKMFDIAVTLDASGQALIVGDITVSGGSEDTADHALDNLGDLTTWLSLSGTTITVGDIDFSGYESAATIDVSTFKGASEITASSGGSDITVNTSQNTITLGAGADTVIWGANETAGTKVASLDTVIGFKAGTDKIDLTFATGTGKAGGDTWGNYDQFLTAAQAANQDAFIGVVGDDTYIAVDGDNGNVVDFVIKLTGVTNITTADITI